MRTTILMLVDPKAEEFEPLSRPRVTGAGMVLWSVGGLAAAVCVWVLRGGEVARSLGARGVDAGFWTILGLAGVVLSAIGALVLIRPTRRTRARQTVLAAMGVLVYLPIAGVFWWIHWHLDGRHPDPYGEPTLTSEARTTLRLAMGALCVMSILLVRRNARGLALRSHLLRSGQIDRQSLLGLAGAFGIAAVGDFIMLFVDNGVLTSEYMRTAGVAMISLGSFLITVGMFAVVLDTVRLYPVLAGRSVGLSDILESNRGRSRRGRADA